MTVMQAVVQRAVASRLKGTSNNLSFHRHPSEPRNRGPRAGIQRLAASKDTGPQREAPFCGVRWDDD
jgi:hypothetical protein